MAQAGPLPQQGPQPADAVPTQAQRLKDTEALTRHLDHLAQYIDSIQKAEAPRA